MIKTQTYINSKFLNLETRKVILYIKLCFWLVFFNPKIHLESNRLPSSHLVRVKYI